MIRINAKVLSSFGRKSLPKNQPNQVRTSVPKGFAWKAFSTSTSVEDFRGQGLLDSQGLTVFDTLHELQETSCKVYANNELFGTFNDESGNFEYLTYKDFGQKVVECRRVLKHLGE
jgi:hypothetical protein